MAGTGSRVHVLMVCTGNICRSPTAEAVLRHLLERQGLQAEVGVGSAGTHGHWHAGEPPDLRSQRHAARRGYDLAALRARCVADVDFERFDLLLAMDEDNLAHLQASCPPQHRGKLRLLMEFAPRGSGRVVPDPYQGGPEGFERVLDLIEAACQGLVPHLQQLKGNKNPA
jgi:protein-tyrosine phosphatase